MTNIKGRDIEIGTIENNEKEITFIIETIETIFVKMIRKNLKIKTDKRIEFEIRNEIEIEFEIEIEIEIVIEPEIGIEIEIYSAIKIRIENQVIGIEIKIRRGKGKGTEIGTGKKSDTEIKIERGIEFGIKERKSEVKEIESITRIDTNSKENRKRRRNPVIEIIKKRIKN